MPLTPMFAFVFGDHGESPGGSAFARGRPLRSPTSPACLVRRQLTVTILGARGLRNADGRNSRGKLVSRNMSDPYCVCEILGKPHTRFQTSVLNNTLDPVWNHAAQVMDFSDGDQLAFYVYDKDYGKTDDPLGHTTLRSVDYLMAGFNGDLRLEGVGAGSSSSLSIKVEAHHPSGFYPHSPPPLVNDNSRHHLAITVVRAGGLPNADRGGLSDPYCVCEVEGKPHTRFRTSVLKNTLDPVWNHFAQIIDHSEGDRLIFSVYDKDWTKDNDPLGWAALESRVFSAKGFDGDLFLEGVGTRRGSYLTVRVDVHPHGGVTSSNCSWRTGCPISYNHVNLNSDNAGGIGIPCQLCELSRRSNNFYHNSHSKGEVSGIVVTVERARGLRNADGRISTGVVVSNNLSDPYCICQIKGKPHTRFKTRVINNSLNPVWNHVEELADYSEGDQLIFHIFDKDNEKEDDDLGWAMLDSVDVQTNGFDGELLLQDSRGHNSYLKIKVHVHPRHGRIPAMLTTGCPTTHRALDFASKRTVDSVLPHERTQRTPNIGGSHVANLEDQLRAQAEYISALERRLQLAR